MKTYWTFFEVLCMLLIFAKHVHCECGNLFGIEVQNLGGWSGEISSPGLANGEYPNHQTCKWNVSIPSASRIEITLQTSELEEDFNGICSDYLQISSGRRVVLKTCGLENTPMTLVLTSHSFMVEFVTDLSTTNRGFLLSYRGLCEFPLKVNTILYTPLYPLAMDDTISCKWTLKAENNTVTIRILGLNGNLPECTNSPLYAKSGDKVVYLCLGKTEFTFYDLTYLYYQVQDHTVFWVGRILVEFLISPKCALADNMPLVMQDWTGVIDSPLTGDDLYPANQDCTWVVNIRSASAILLKFVLFDLNRDASNGTCLDYVKITDTSNVLFDECNEILLPYQVLSKTNRVEVTFHSNKDGSGLGFELTFSGVCGGNVAEDSVLETPNYPSPPLRDIECEWQIGSASKTTVIELVVERNEPACKRFILKVLSSLEGEMISDEICVDRPTMAHRQSLKLVYSYRSPRGSVQSHWWGKLMVNVSDNFKKEDCTRLCNTSLTCTVKMTLRTHNYICICSDDRQLLGCDNEALCQADFCFKKNRAVVFCPSDYGDQSSWASTAAGLLDVQSCPNGATGESYRMCDTAHETQNKLLAVWSNPDQTFCNSREYSKMWDAKNFTEQAASFNGSTVLEMLKLVSNMSNSMESKHSLEPRVYPGDLFFIADVLDQLAVYVEITPSLQSCFTGEYLKLYLETFAGMVSRQALTIFIMSKPYYVWSMLQKVLKASSTFIKTLVMQKIVNENFTLNSKNPNFYFQIVDWIDGLNFTIGNIDVTLPNSSQILLPKDGRRPKLIFRSYKHLAGYLQFLHYSGEKENDFFEPITDILSFEAVNESYNNGALENPIEIIFHLPDDEDPMGKKSFLCVELKLPPSSATYMWSTIGCTTSRVSTQDVRCHCMNMTVLTVVESSRMKINMMFLSKQGDTPTRMLHEMLIACIFTSLLCLLTLWSKRNLSPNQWFVLWHQAISIVLLEISFMLTSTLGQFEAMQEYVCYGLAAFLHYSVTVVGFWMFVNALYVWLEAEEKECGKIQLAFKFTSWGVPIILILIGVVGFEPSYYSPQICWVDSKVMITLVAPPFYLLFALSLLTYFYVLTKTRDKQGDKVTLHANYWMSVLVCFSFYLTWTFAFVSLYRSDIKIVHVTSQIASSAFNSCTGALLFLNYSICFSKRTEQEKTEVILFETPMPAAEIEPPSPAYHYEEESQATIPTVSRYYQRNPDYTWSPILEHDQPEKSTTASPLTPIPRKPDISSTPSTDKVMPGKYEFNKSIFFRKKPERSWNPSPVDDEQVKWKPPSVGHASPQEPDLSMSPPTENTTVPRKNRPSIKNFFRKKTESSQTTTPDEDDRRKSLRFKIKPSQRNPEDSRNSSFSSSPH